MNTREIHYNDWGLPDDRADHWRQAEESQRRRRELDILERDRVAKLEALNQEIQDLKDARLDEQMQADWLRDHPDAA